MGVWIETQIQAHFGITPDVTPFVGVWIETSSTQTARPQQPVTPFVGVWIETTKCCRTTLMLQGHTLRGCVD